MAVRIWLYVVAKPYVYAGHSHLVGRRPVLEVDFNNSVTEDYSPEYHDRISFIQF